MVGLGWRDCVKRPATCDVGMSDASVSGEMFPLTSSPAACVRSDRKLALGELDTKRWIQQTRSRVATVGGSLPGCLAEMEKTSGGFEVHSFRGTRTSSSSLSR